MTRSFLIATALVGFVVAFPARAHAEDDPWFGKDKALHLAATSTIAAGGYAVGAIAFEARGHALLFGGGLALTAGVVKEALDLGGLGQASWKDLAWDGIGTAAGLLVAWGVDLVVRGVSARRPLLDAPPPGGVGVAVTF